MTDEFPAGWTKTIDDLLAEAKDPVGPPETDWAKAYERSLLRPWARFPIHDEVYEAAEEIVVGVLTHWGAPFTGGRDGTLPKGTRVRVHVFPFEPEPIRVYAHPLYPEALEHRLVPEAELRNSNYKSFSVLISTADLNKHFRRVESIP
jgi:hypothetical protein